MSDFDLKLFQTDTDKAISKRLKEIEGLEKRAIDAGIDPALTKPRENLFMKALNLIDKPKQIMQGVIDSAFIRGDLASLSEGGLIPDILASARRAQEERQNGFDLLRRAGVKNPIARTIGGFAIELVTDPLVLLGGAAKNAAKQGGIALSNTGAGKAKKILDSMIDPLSSTQDILHAGGKLNEGLKSFKKAIKITDQLDFLSNKSSLNTFQKITQRKLEKELTILQPKFNKMFNLADDLDIFADTGLSARLQLPFVGNLTKGKRAAEESGGVLGTLGQIFNPAKFKGDILTVNPKGGIKFMGKKISEKAKPMWMHEVELSVKGALDAFGDVAGKGKEALDSLPVVGDVSKAVTEAAKGLGKAKDVLAEGLQRSFARKFLVGDLTESTLKEFNATKAGLRAKGLEVFRETFPELDLGDPKKSEAFFKETALAIDELNADFVKNHLTKAIRKLPKDKRSLTQAEFAKLVDATDEGLASVTDVLSQTMGGADAAKLLEIENRKFILDNAPSDEIRDAIKRTFGLFDDIYKKEIKYGVREEGAAFFSAYIPHVYKNANKLARQSSKQGRKYLSLEDAFIYGGYIGHTDLRELFESRYFASELAIAQKRYANRAILEASLPATTYRNLVVEALDESDPIGSAAAKKILADTDLPLPTNIKHLEGSERFARYTSEGLDEALSSLPGVEKIKDPEIKLKLAKQLSKSDNEFRQILRKAGFQPLDSEFPVGLNGEIAKVVKIGNEERILPKGIADAIEETIYQKDIIKQAFKGHPALEWMLGKIDTAVNHMKGFVTLPWPQYWANNIVSDRLFDIMDKGISGIDPGQWAHTAKLLDGTADLITDTGQTITAKQFNSYIKHLGIEYTLADMAEYAKNFQATDIAHAAKKAKGYAAKSLAKGEVRLGLEQASDFMRSNFENFFRVNSFMHHLKRGSGLADAVRISQEALLDYRQLTNIEQSIARRFYMFYGWISKSTRKTLKSYFLSPGDLQIQLATAKSIQEAFSSPDALPTPEEYDARMLDSMLASEQLSVALGRDKEGNKLTGRLRGLPLNTMLENFSAQMPRTFTMGEIMDSFADSTHRTLQKQFAAANPFIKAPIERISGKNLYFDRDLDSQFLRRLPSLEAAAEKLAVFPHDSIPMEVFKTLDDGAKEFLNATPDGKGYMIVEPGLMWTLVNFYPPLARALSTVGGFSNEKIPLNQALLKTFSGVKVDSADIEQLFLNDQASELRKLLKEKNVSLKEKRKKEEASFF